MLNKVIIVLLLIILIFQLGCKSGRETKEKIDKNEFEGVITYHEVNKATDGILKIDDTVQMFYSHGNFVKIHSIKFPEPHIVKDYYLEKHALRLMLFSNSDSLQQINLSFPVQRLDCFKVTKADEQIFSKKCENIELNISYHEKDSTTYTDSQITFSRGYLKVDKNHFKNWNLGFYNKVIDECGCLYLKFKAVHFDSSHKNILWWETLDVISVKEESVDPKVFEIDTTKVRYAK
ncbi:hypothetical protein ACFGVR_13850 [Mucilaginibacter sp. AW1-3]